MTEPFERTEIAQIQTGTVNTMNTDWPVRTIVERERYGKRVSWIVTYGICNGTASGSETFRTRREALEAAGIEG